jgi:rRNA maturation endonuclease Nob1
MSKSKVKPSPGVTSHCVMCGRDFHNLILDKCPRCGGLCNRFTDNDMRLMEHRQSRGEIVLPDTNVNRY